MGLWYCHPGRRNDHWNVSAKPAFTVQTRQAGQAQHLAQVHPGHAKREVKRQIEGAQGCLAQRDAATCQAKAGLGEGQKACVVQFKVKAPVGQGP